MQTPEDAIIAFGGGIRNNTLGSVLTKSKVLDFRCISLSCQDNIMNTFTAGKLTEHHDIKLVITGELFDTFVTSPILSCEILEVVTKLDA